MNASVRVGVTNRRVFLGGAAAIMVASASSRLPALAAARGGAFRTSLSVSPCAEAVLASGPLADGLGSARTVRQLQEMFNRHGATEVFARVATRAQARVGDAEYGFARALERARLARSLGMPFNPELGLWPIYGDVRSQLAPDFGDYPTIRLPGPWSSLELDQMASALRLYGATVARQILSTGVRVNYWDLGNEIEYGIAGVAVRGFDPTGYVAPDAIDPAIGTMTVPQLLSMTQVARIAWLRQHLWPYVGRLLAAVADGVRSVDRAARFSTHISGMAVNDPEFPVAFWRSMHHNGYHPDQLGTSFYPTNGDPGDRRSILLDVATALHREFGRPLFLAECAYPSDGMKPPFAWNTAQPGYPQTPDGQYSYLRDLTAAAKRAGTISGIRPWGPDYCASDGGWAPMSLFTTAGVAKPALRAISDGLPATT